MTTKDQLSFEELREEYSTYKVGTDGRIYPNEKYGQRGFAVWTCSYCGRNNPDENTYCKGCSAPTWGRVNVKII